MLLILIPLMLLFVGFDIAAKRIYFLRTIYLKIFGKMLRKHELTSKKVFLNGASWVFISSVVILSDVYSGAFNLFIIVTESYGQSLTTVLPAFVSL